MAAKVANDNDDIVKVPGLSWKWSRFDPGPFLEQLDWLTRAVEEMTGQMCRVVDATCLVARGNERLTAGLETFLEECRFFTAPWDEDKEWSNKKSRGSKRNRRTLAAACQSNWSSPDFVIECKSVLLLFIKTSDLGLVSDIT